MIFKRSLIAELANLAGAVFTVLFTIVLAVAMVRFLNMAAGGSIEHGTVVQLVLYNALVNLPPLLAASLFIATLMTLMRSWQDNEMVVWFRPEAVLFCLGSNRQLSLRFRSLLLLHCSRLLFRLGLGLKPIGCATAYLHVKM